MLCARLENARITGFMKAWGTPGRGQERKRALLLRSLEGAALMPEAPCTDSANAPQALTEKRVDLLNVTIAQNLSLTIGAYLLLARIAKS